MTESHEFTETVLKGIKTRLKLVMWKFVYGPGIGITKKKKVN